MEHKQVKSVKIEEVAFLARDMPTHARDMPTHQDVHTSGYSCGVQLKCAKEDNWKYYSVLSKYHKGF